MVYIYLVLDITSEPQKFECKLTLIKLLKLAHVKLLSLKTGILSRIKNTPESHY